MLLEQAAIRQPKDWRAGTLGKRKLLLLYQNATGGLNNNESCKDSISDNLYAVRCCYGRRCADVYSTGI